MYFVEYAPSILHRDWAGGDDLPWTRYSPGFESFERAENEAKWLGIDEDDRYVYRVVEVKDVFEE